MAIKTGFTVLVFLTPTVKFLHAFCHLLIIYKIYFFEEKNQEYHQRVKQFGPRSGHFVGPDQGTNYLQRLSGDNYNISMQIVRRCRHLVKSA